MLSAHTRRRISFLIVLAVFSLGAPSWAKDLKGAKCDALYARLQRAIDAHDTIYPNPKLPPVRLDLTKKQMSEYFELSRGLWKSSFDRKMLRAVIRKLDNGEKLSEAEAEGYRVVRSRLKQLRFACMAFDRKHVYPKALDRLTTELGHLQDALKNGKSDLAHESAEQVISLLNADSVARIDRELSRFKPSTMESFRAWLRSQATELEEDFGGPTLTSKKFHESRKVISRLVAIYDMLETLEPAPERRQIVEFLSTLNGRMGGEHDGMIAGKLDGSLDYTRDRVEIPADLRGWVAELVKEIKAGTAP